MVKLTLTICRQIAHELLVLKGLILKIRMRFYFYTKAKMKIKTPKFEKKYSTIT